MRLSTATQQGAWQLSGTTCCRSLPASALSLPHPHPEAASRPLIQSEKSSTPSCIVPSIHGVQQGIYGTAPRRCCA